MSEPSSQPHAKPPGVSNESETISFNVIDPIHEAITPGVHDIKGRMSLNNINPSNDQVRQESTPSGNKRRKLMSKVWEDYTKYKGDDEKEWAICKHCKKLVDLAYRETNLKNHLERCRIKRVVTKESVNNQVLNHVDVSRAIIKLGVLSLSSLKPDILHVYNLEKENLRRSLAKLSCQFSLVINLFGRKEGRLFLTLYYIDDSWELKKKILRFFTVEQFDLIIELIRNTLIDFKIDKNMFSIVVVNSYNVDVEYALREVKSLLGDGGSLSSGEQLFHVGYLLDTLEQTCLGSQSLPYYSSALQKLRLCFKYVHKTSVNVHMFQVAACRANSQGSIPRGYIYDFELLETSVRFREVFSELEQMDPDFKAINLAKEEWEEAKAIYECWEAINAAVVSFSECKYNTSNVYFPMVCDIYLKLLLWEKSKFKVVRSIALDMESIHNYWSNCSLVLAIAVILDPRFKMEIVECWYKKIYGSAAGSHLLTIFYHLGVVYWKYARGLNSYKPESSSFGHNANISTSNKMLDRLGRPCTTLFGVDVKAPKSELKRYLKEPKFPSIEDFDILAWWRVNSLNFPTLARMARDFLAVPFAYSVSDSVLKKEVRDIVNHDESDDLVKDIEALVCSQSWLES